MKIFESLISCCSVHITAVGFPPCELRPVDAHTTGCQPSTTTDCISDRGGTGKGSPRENADTGKICLI